MKQTVLYVDDEEANLRTFRSAFRREFEIITATSGKEGLKILENLTPNVLITDQMMPEMNGVEFLKQFYEKDPKSTMARIMLSGHAKSHDVKEAMDKYQLLKFIPKPWDIETLKSIIKEVT
jgi:response regulator RpfG family c-di-GMP phosphodiesterase